MAKRILIVDDDCDFREATRLILSSGGYEVVEAGNSKEAEQALAAGKIDLIILDVMMDTDTEGFHLAYQIRRDEKLKDVPIIIMTCVEEKTGEVIDASKAGDFLPVQAFLRKPLNAAELKSKVASLVK